MVKKFLSLSLIFFLFGCRKASLQKNGVDTNTNGVQKHLIGFSIDTLAIERWQRDLDIFMASVKECDADIIIQNAGNSVEEQKKQLHYLLDRNVDVAVILPRDAGSLVDEVNLFKSRGIPVISYDRLILNAPIDLYITIDSEAVGRIMGEEMLRRAEPNNWLCMLGSKEDYNMTLVQAGLLKAIKNPNIISETFYTDGWNYDLSRQKMIDVIATGVLPNAILCGNDAIADSVISVLKSYMSDYQIPVCGQDADIIACQNIVKGLQTFTVYKPIGALAQTAAVYSVRIAEGEKIENLVAEGSKINNGLQNVPTLVLDPKAVTIDNIDKIIIDSAFHTRNEVYIDEE